MNRYNSLGIPRPNLQLLRDVLPTESYLVMTQLRNLERLLPGKFDIWGHSHQLFHIVTGIGALLQLNAILEMQEYASQTECENIIISNTTEILPVNDR